MGRGPTGVSRPCTDVGPDFPPSGQEPAHRRRTRTARERTKVALNDRSRRGWKRDTTARRHRRAVVVSLGALVAVLVTPHGAATGPLDGWSSSNVEFVRNVPLPYAGGGLLRGDNFYLLHANGLDVYDVSRPEEPERISQLLFPAGQLASFVDPDSNGRILLASQYPSPNGGTSTEAEYPTTTLSVIDVRDPANPSVLANLPNAGDHNMTCLLDCTWAYGGAFGYIVDLRDPRAPVLREERWTDSLGIARDAFDSHDVTEVAPGIVLTASVPMFLLDVGADPVHPKVLAKSDGSPHSYGGVEWAGRGRDRLILSFASPGATPPSCASRQALEGTTFNSGFKTWDATAWRSTGLITGLQEYAPSDGAFVDGAPAAGFFPLFGGCVASWFSLHPKFRNGGLVAQAYGSYGVRFLEIGRSGSIDEVGYWLPAGGQAAFAAYWVTKDIVYATNVDRGLDILRFKPAR